MLERLRFEHELLELGISGTREIQVGSGEAGRKPVLLTHYHVQKRLHPGPGLLSDSDPVVMKPSQMRPGFVDAADPRRTALQTALTNLVSAKHQSKLSPKVHLKIALVDLTEYKSHTPIIAGYGEHDSMYVASLPKILVLYTAYQLRFDLNTFARLNGIKKISELKKSILKEWSKAGLESRLAPKLDVLFQFKESPASTVQAELWWRTPEYIHKDEFSQYVIVNPPKEWEKSEDYRMVTRSVHKGMFAKYVIVTPLINNNMFPRYLILTLGFDYIGSVALSSGLFDEKLGGLWLNAAYMRPWRSWSNSPFPRAKSHNATALAAASFFTLLDQGRLVNQITSNEIAKELKKELCFPSGGMLDGIKTLPGAPTMIYPNIPPNKCGRLCKKKDCRDGAGYFSEAIQMDREPAGGKHLKYIAAILTEQDPFMIGFPELGMDLDALIAAQNP